MHPRFTSLCSALLALCTMATAASAITFERVTDVSNPIVSDGGTGNSRYYGCAWVDYDMDGDPDLFTDLDVLYRNDGGGNFVRITGTGLGAEQVASPGFSMSGVSWGDFDNDGDPDAFIAGELSHLYRNDGAAGFTNVTTSLIDDPVDVRGWTVAWGDIDLDGNLDFIVTHPGGFIPGGAPLTNQLFFGDGPPNYTFREVTTDPLVQDMDTFTIGSFADFDWDGDLDFFIGSGPADGSIEVDNLFRNLWDETGLPDFERITDSPLATDLQDGQLWQWIDYDNDQDLDGFLTNWEGNVSGLDNRLYEQGPAGVFTNVSGQPITEDGGASLPSIWEDFDNDGDLDCYVGNDGFTRDFLYENNGDGTFTKRTDTPVTAPFSPRRSASAADYDGDGDIDLFVNGPGTSRALYENTDSSGNHFLKVALRGTSSNASGIGAKVRVLATIDGSAVWQVREINAQNSFQGHSDYVAHFGLGDAATADSVVVEWPGDGVSIEANVPGDILVTIIEGETSSTEPYPSLSTPAVTASPNPSTGSTTIRFYLETADAVSVSVFDAAGRLVRRFAEDSRRAGSHVVEWDGRDGSGRLVPNGSYQLRLETTSGATNRSLRILR